MALYASIPRLLAPEDAEPLARRADELREQGVPEDLAMRVAALPIMFSALDIVEVADETRPRRGAGRRGALPARQPARAALAARPHRRAARATTAGARCARAALRDDLYAIHRELTAEVLRSAPPDAEPDGLVDAWIDANPASERSLQTLGDIRGGQSFDLTTLPVAVREVRNLIARR